MKALLLYVGSPGGQAWEHDEKLVGTQKHPRCCECHRRFKSEARRGVWPAIKHNPRCPAVSAKQEPVAAAAPAAPPRSHKRARSDPGEASLAQRPRTQPQAMTSRITPSKGAFLKQQRKSAPAHEAIMRRLEETHARRMHMAATEAEVAAQSESRNGFLIPAH